METSTGKPRRRVGPGGRGPRSAGAGRGVRAAGIAGAGRRAAGREARARVSGRGSAGAGRRDQSVLDGRLGLVAGIRRWTGGEGWRAASGEGEALRSWERGGGLGPKGWRAWR